MTPASSEVRAHSDTAPVRHLVPLGAENRWSDLLAAMIETSPESVASILGLGDSPQDVIVAREAPAGGRDRVDLIISAGGEQRCIAEAKVLSALGLNQLKRYRDAYPDVAHHVLITSKHLPIDAPRSSGWRSVRWEELLHALASSSTPWVAATAAAWLGYLQAALPRLAGETRWNDLRPGEGFVIAMRARMSWIYQQLQPPAPVEHDLVSSSAGQSWVARAYLPAHKPGYSIYVEAEERLGVRSYPKFAGDPRWGSPQGPSVKVSLMQTDVTTSAGFDWDYLHALWPTMASARDDWVRRSAHPKAAHDRAGWRRMVGNGAPPYLGVGFGEKQALRSGQCMFGARYQLPADATLSEIAADLNATARLVPQLAAVAAPDSGRPSPSARSETET